MFYLFVSDSCPSCRGLKDRHFPVSVQNLSDPARQAEAEALAAFFFVASLPVLVEVDDALNVTGRWLSPAEIEKKLSSL